MRTERTGMVRRLRVVVSISIAVTAFAAAAGAAVKKADWVADYSAVAMGTGHTGAAAGRAGRVNIEIYRWTTAEERQALLELIATGDGKKIRKGLDQLEDVGRVRLPGQGGYELIYAWQIEEGGKKRVVAAMNRALLSAPGVTTGAEYLVGVTVLDPDEGKGVIAPAIELAIQPDGRIEVTESAADPIQLTNVKSET